MKKLLCILGIAVSGTGSFAQNGAVMEFKLNSSKGITGTMKIFYAYQGSRMEMNMIVPQMPDGGFSKTTLVKSVDRSKLYAIDDKNKTYTTAAISTTQQGTSSNITVKVIGMEKVAGYNCKHVLLTKGTEVSEFWTTRLPTSKNITPIQK